MLGSFATIAQESKEEAQKPLVWAPIVSSNPSMGTGLGLTTSYLYDLGDNSESNTRSQMLGVAQYTNTDSYTLGLRNKVYWDQDQKTAMSALWYLNIENDFSGAEFTTNSYGAFHRQSWQVIPNWYLGLQGVAIWSKYGAKNPLGQHFLDINGAGDDQVIGLGVNVTYDTSDNVFYPHKGQKLEVNTFSYRDAFGSDQEYDVLELNYGYYHLLTDLHILAVGLYGRYVSDDAPYSGESYLGRRSVLRGFNAGEISGTSLNGIQAEYRYHHSELWKFVAFAGAAHVGGGNAEKRDTEGWYYSGGVGVRYALQPKDRVHLRLDLAMGNDDNQGFYIGFQEAF